LIVGFSAFSYIIFNRDFEEKISAKYTPQNIKHQILAPESSDNLAFDFYQIEEGQRNGETEFVGIGSEENDFALNNSSKDSLFDKTDSLDKIDVRIPILPKKDVQDIQIAFKKDSLYAEENNNTIAANDPYVSKTKELGWKDVLVKGAEKITGKEVAFVEDLPNDDEKRWSLSIGRFGIERVKD